MGEPILLRNENGFGILLLDPTLRTSGTLLSSPKSGRVGATNFFSLSSFFNTLTLCGTTRGDLVGKFLLNREPGYGHSRRNRRTHTRGKSLEGTTAREILREKNDETRTATTFDSSRFCLETALIDGRNVVVARRKMVATFFFNSVTLFLSSSVTLTASQSSSSKLCVCARRRVRTGTNCQIALLVNSFAFESQACVRMNRQRGTVH